MIKTLKEIGTNNILYPKTDVSAVLKENGESIEANLIPDGGSLGLILQYAENGVSWDYPFKDYTNILAYGIEWDTTISDPDCTRIGNMSLHKSLPIQSLMKGCICKEGELVYWLNEKDWRFKLNPEYGTLTTYEWVGINEYIPKIGKFNGYITTVIVSETGFITNINLFDMLWVKIEGYPALMFINSNGLLQIISEYNLGDYGTNTEDAKFIYTNVEIGSCTNGYDGCVKVYVPEFYLKSEIEGNKRRVWLSTIKLDDSWIHQEALLVDAYRTTCLLSVPLNYGYLSTLKVNTLLSVANYTINCRGGSTNNANDKYFTGEGIAAEDILPIRSHICKPRTNTSRANMRTWARQSENTALINYEQYKNILYWLFVVEYATFHSLKAFNSELTSEGYHQGGLGDGVTTTSYEYWTNFNSTYPIIPCGYTNELGNITNVKLLVIPEFKVDVGSITNFKNATIKNTTYVTKDSDYNIIITPKSTSITGTILLMSPTLCSPVTTYKIEGLDALRNYLIENNITYTLLMFGMAAVPITFGSSDGEHKVNWGYDGSGGQNSDSHNYKTREIRLTLLVSLEIDMSAYPIKISIVSAEAGYVMTPSTTFKVPKYRGIEQPFGDVWTNLDGVIIDTHTHETNVDYVYTCNDPAKYADTITEDYTKIGEKIRKSGFVKYFDLLKNCNIFASEVGGSSLLYKCDNTIYGAKNNILLALYVGGDAYGNVGCGLSCLNPSLTIDHSGTTVGFRSCSYPSFTL